MLLAVEGGGFFSSSASGYSKGLALLLLGRGKEERPMRVAPWNQYQLVEHEQSDLDHQQLASKKSRSPSGCASFICFNRASAGVDGSSSPPPPKVSPVGNSVNSLDSSSSESDCHQPCTTNHTVDKIERRVSIKSSIKKPSTICLKIGVEGDPGCETMEEVQKSVVDSTERRVHWTDSCGGELVVIREFEPSDDGSSDDEFEHEGGHKCQCVIQ